MKTKLLLIGLVLALATFSSAQQGVNLVPTEQWTVGDGPVGDFLQYGTTDENSRVYLDGPHDNSVLVWQAESNATGSSDGGFVYNLDMDAGKTYQYSIWVRNPNIDANGRIQFRAKSNTVTRLNNDPVTTAYMYLGDIPFDDEWYLMVGYVHAFNTTQLENNGKIYRKDGTTFRKITDFKFLETTTTGHFIVGLRNCTIAGRKQYFWKPRIEEVNGNETTVTDLISNPPASKYVAGNCLPSDEWLPGPSAQPPFNKYGADLENERLYEQGPYEDNVVVWKTKSDGLNNNSGGFYIDDANFDNSKTYRYMIWMKRHTATLAGGTYFGARNTSNFQYYRIDNNSPSINPYFWIGDLPEVDKWYLAVGYIHGSDFQGTESRGGVYDIETGEKVFSAQDFRFTPNAFTTRLRVFLNKCTVADAGNTYWNPIIEEYNESSKPISTYFLGTDGLWRPVGTEDAVYKRSGTVGIGLANDAVLDPAYKLMVDGVVKSREVKVNPDNWADFVFEKDYPLPTLAEVEKHIQEKGYLPNIPSAGEVKKNGIRLGEMDAKLLQKIEELTLYQIAMQRRMDEMAAELRLLKSNLEE